MRGYFITRMAPGGPAEAMMRKTLALSAVRSSKDAGGTLMEEQKKQIIVRVQVRPALPRGLAHVARCAAGLGGHGDCDTKETPASRAKDCHHCI